MATAAEYGVELGRTYSSRKGSRSPNRYVMWISSDGLLVQYDGPAVPLRSRYPEVSADTFAKWAGMSEQQDATR
ncbi:MAG: hypothetical protein AAGK66_08950 [Pseudomonadota bacterium]